MITSVVPAVIQLYGFGLSQQHHAARLEFDFQGAEETAAL